MPTKEDREYLETIPDDEPVFIVRAKDKFSLDTIAGWITRARRASVNAAKINRALQKQDQVAEFWADHRDRIKLPD